MADYIDGAIEQDLKVPGADDVTARYRTGPRKVIFEGGTFLRPTIVRCDSFAHPLANREFLCPYASVVQVRAGGDARTRSAHRWWSRSSRAIRRSSRKLLDSP